MTSRRSHDLLDPGPGHLGRDDLPGDGLPSDDLAGSAADAAATQADYHGVGDPDDEGRLALLTRAASHAEAWRAVLRRARPAS